MRAIIPKVNRMLQSENRINKGEIQMKYFAVFLPMKDKERGKFRQEHLDFLQEMRNKERILLFGRLVDGTGGLIIYQGTNAEEVTAWAKEDPYVKLGARGFEIHEWAMQTDFTITK